MVVASACLCITDLTDKSINRIKSYDDNPAHVIRALVQIVPCQIGNADSTNNTGELAAYVLADALLPPDMPHVTITDSMSVRGPLLSSRNATEAAPARVQIRHSFPRLGKALMSKADSIIHRRKTAQTNKFPTTAKRVKEFTDAANRRWKRHPKCKDDQYDFNTTFPYIHQKSHQLTNTGALKTKDEQKIAAYPSYLAAHLNHFADRICTITLERIGRAQIDADNNFRPFHHIGPQQQPLSLLYSTIPQPDTTTTPEERTRHGKIWSALLQTIAEDPHLYNLPDDPANPNGVIDRRPFYNIPTQEIQFGYLRCGKLVDRSITHQIKDDMTTELQLRLGKRARHGAFARSLTDVARAEVKRIKEVVIIVSRAE